MATCILSKGVAEQWRAYVRTTADTEDGARTIAETCFDKIAQAITEAITASAGRRIWIDVNCATGARQEGSV